jgi:hypothetical protein
MTNKKALVKVDDALKKKVEKKVAGTSTTIGQYYDEAVKEKMKPKAKVIP